MGDSQQKPGQNIVVFEDIEAAIHEVRGERVILDSDLARLYGVATKTLNRAVKRNAERFPEDFLFTLTRQELTDLRRQIGTSKNQGPGGRRTLPYAFTEHGVIMAANLLNSPRAAEMSVYVVRAFVRLRRALAGHKDLAARVEAVERTLTEHDDAIRELVHAVRALMAPPSTPRRTIGFKTPKPAKD
jgi:hypothetical protein